MDAVLKIVQTVNMYLSDYILIIMLIGCGLYFSFKTKFVQVRCFGEGWRKVFGNFSLHGGKHEGGMSSFQALATAIAAQAQATSSALAAQSSSAARARSSGCG